MPCSVESQDHPPQLARSWSIWKHTCFWPESPLPSLFGARNDGRTKAASKWMLLFLTGALSVSAKFLASPVHWSPLGKISKHQCWSFERNGLLWYKLGVWQKAFAYIWRFSSFRLHHPLKGDVDARNIFRVWHIRRAHLDLFVICKRLWPEVRYFRQA